MPIIGTAGHVDHGKSTLVHALTGRDPDRWAEEKARGLTIDLGFAWVRMGDHDVGFVDVPGHERFIKNMLAGVGGMNVALLVVAADEGWMPQSAEHLAVLDLLAIEHGVIALTRVDVADEELIEFSKADIAEHVEATVAQSWPVIEVAAPAGIGHEQLIAALTETLDAAGSPPDLGRPRIWIDRSFTVAGTGTVVTGTLTGGSISVGDRLRCYPGDDVRIRGVQAHEAGRETLPPGSRVALNVTGADRDALVRGSLLAAPESLELTRRFLSTLRLPSRSDVPVDDRGSYHVHIGTAAVPARLRIIGDGAAVILTTSAPLPVAMGDRFVLRDTGRKRVVAGGTVLDPAPLRRVSEESIAALSAALREDADGRADVLVTVHGEIDGDLVRRTSGGGTPTQAFSIGGRCLSHDRFGRLRSELADAIDEYHARYPLRGGLPKSEAASRLGADPAIVAALADADPDIVEEGPVMRRDGFVIELRPSDVGSWNAARAKLAEHLAVPRASDLGLDEEVLHALIRRGDLVRIDSDLVLLPQQVERITRGLSNLPDGFTVAQFRDEFGLTRRQAVPLLEWLDAEGWTRRTGDERSLREPSG